MDQYVVFRHSKRVCLREEDMTAEKLSRIFQVHHLVRSQSLYVSDDANVAWFPGASGVFDSYDLTPRGHYEVTIPSICLKDSILHSSHTKDPIERVRYGHE
ncbi:hypothetical protein KUCAC02_032527 [Chaenocephalus aceratus]|nr:hypothetical protein KUCAC02_032527 [Chaenocephalus aceratus]